MEIIVQFVLYMDFELGSGSTLRVSMRSCIELRECSIHTTIDAIDISNSLLPIDVNNTIHTIHAIDVDNTIVDTIVVIV